MKITITIRDAHGTFTARAKGLNITASCTGGPETAMRRCVAKVAPGRPYVFERSPSDDYGVGDYRVEIMEET